MSPARPLAAAALLAAALALGLLGASCGRRAPSGRFVGKPPPAFSTVDATWFNSPAVAWSDLRGKVVLVELGFLH